MHAGTATTYPEYTFRLLPLTVGEDIGHCSSTLRYVDRQGDVSLRIADSKVANNSKQRDSASPNPDCPHMQTTPKILRCRGFFFIRHASMPPVDCHATPSELFPSGSR